MRGRVSFGIPIVHHRQGDIGEKRRQREKFAGYSCIQTGTGLSHYRARLIAIFSFCEPRKWLGSDATKILGVWGR